MALLLNRPTWTTVHSTHTLFSRLDVTDRNKTNGITTRIVLSPNQQLSETSAAFSLVGNETKVQIALALCCGDDACLFSTTTFYRIFEDP